MKGEFLVVIAVMVARFIFCCYRAKHQSISIDEASTYLSYLDGPWRLLKSQYTANNHILYTILSKLCISLFGLSEFTFRLPSVIAGFFLTLGTFQLTREIKDRLLGFAAFLAVCLHPLLLDLSVAARGYSLSIALLIWAICFIRAGRLRSAGILLGLANAANLSVAFPSISLFVAVIALSGIHLWKAIRDFFIPCLLTFAIICWVPMRKASKSHFYLGFPHLSDTLYDFVQSSIHTTTNPGLFGATNYIELISRYVLPLFALVAVAGTLRQAMLNFEQRGRLMPLVMISVTTLGFVLAHLCLSVPFPVDRTIMCMVPLICVAWSIAGDGCSKLVFRLVWALPILLVIVQFATQLHSSYFSTWPFNADDKHISELLLAKTAALPADSVSVSCTWTQQPGLEFYRKSWAILALKPIERRDRAVTPGFDYYVLNSVFDRAPDMQLLFIDHPYAGDYSITLGIP